MKCNICNGQMKRLLTSDYCPNDCDRKTATANDFKRAGYISEPNLPFVADEVKLPAQFIQLEFKIEKQEIKNNIIEDVQPMKTPAGKLFKHEHVYDAWKMATEVAKEIDKELLEWSVEEIHNLWGEIEK